MLTSSVIKNPAGESMVLSYSWGFTTGVLNLQTPPPVNPLLIPNPAIPPDAIRIQPRRRVGVDLSQEFDIIFPGSIDPDSFSMDDLLLSIEPILGVPGVIVPPDLQYSATVNNNKISIKVTGW